jgi:prepilin-type N-terminal cleavage/methylation domain-containing protein
MIKFNSKNNRGFTLVEMMVAIAVFSIVMVVAMGALLNVIDADQKAESIRTAVDNVNFALESISKDMRVSTDYNCGADENTTPTGDCTSTGGHIISYKSVKESGNYVYYKYTTVLVDGKSTGQIQRCVGSTSNSGCSNYSAITSTEVNITAMKFYVTGTTQNSAPNKTQPRVVITLSGLAGIKTKIQTTFDLQTSVSQRARVNN